MGPESGSRIPEGAENWHPKVEENSESADLAEIRQAAIDRFYDTRSPRHHADRGGSIVESWANEAGENAVKEELARRDSQES